MFDFAKSLAKCSILLFFLLSFSWLLLSTHYVPVLNDVGDKREKKKLWPLTFARPQALVSRCYTLGCLVLNVLGAGGFEEAEILDHEDIDYVSQICSQGVGTNNVASPGYAAMEKQVGKM